MERLNWKGIKVLFIVMVLMLFFMNYNIVDACSTTTNPECKSDSNSESNSNADASAIATGIGIGNANSEANAIGIGGNSLSNSSAVGIGGTGGTGIGVGGVGGGAKVDNTNVLANQNNNANNSANWNTAQGGQGGAAVLSSYDSNVVNPFIVTDIEGSKSSNGDQVTNVGPITSEGSSAYSGGNSMKNIYNNVDRLDAYNTYIKMEDIEYSTDNISGEVNYQDNGWEHPSAGIALRYTHAFGTKPAKRALEAKINKMEAEKIYFDTQVQMMNVQQMQVKELHDKELSLLDEKYQKEINEKNLESEARIAGMCKDILTFLKVREGSTPTEIYNHCYKYDLIKKEVIKSKVNKLVVPKVETKKPCEGCSITINTNKVEVQKELKEVIK